MFTHVQRFPNLLKASSFDSLSSSYYCPLPFPSQPNFMKICLFISTIFISTPPHISASCNFFFSPQSAETILDKVYTMSSIFFNPTVLMLLWLFCSICCYWAVPSPFLALCLTTLFHKWFWVAHWVIASPGTVFSFYLHKHLVTSISPFGSQLRVPFPLCTDQSTQLPVLCLTSHYHRLQLDV